MRGSRRNSPSLESQTQLRRLAVVPEMNFSSNDYLALSHDVLLQRAVAAAMSAGTAVGSTGSRLLSGNAAIWETLESELAQFTGAEAALYFNSGYAANIDCSAALPVRATPSFRPGKSRQHH